MSKSWEERALEAEERASTAEAKLMEWLLQDRDTLTALGTMGFRFNNARRYCSTISHALINVPAVVWDDQHGWCANCNPFSISIK